VKTVKSVLSRSKLVRKEIIKDDVEGARVNLKLRMDMMAAIVSAEKEEERKLAEQNGDFYVQDVDRHDRE